MKVYQIKMIDEENWDGENDSVVKTKKSGAIGFEGLPVRRKRTHEKTEKAANDNESDSTGASP